ncbi:hypothetical protein LLE49_22255 [Alicyclobacillus tolerans]|uniref:hypothetical protein n=1 Tax=Alicyclobacillus tolerans TaxID=90970 RepID=UPI001F1FA156|nr:hypothetical protein [Alicyclobacillus tolerans]MCF8567445.1 hypothetical protein [Alicyclobacillus tolerans]
MKTLQNLFDEVETQVQEQQEQDEWEALAAQQFPALCEQLYAHVQTLLQPLVHKLSQYQAQSVAKVWNVVQDNTQFKVQFGERELEFRPIGQEAKQPGDRFTLRLFRKNEDLIGRYVLFLPPGSTELQLGVLGHGSVTERLDERHLVDLLLSEFLPD